MTLHTFEGRSPQVADGAFVAPTADVIGDVVVGEGASIWYGAVLRGDVMPIRIGARTSIQDNSVVHATGGWHDAIVGEDCTVGHSVILHGCTVGDRVLVGMGSVVLDEAVIGSDVVLGAGSLVTARSKIPPGVLAFGRPAKAVRELKDSERKMILESVDAYLDLIARYTR